MERATKSERRRGSALMTSGGRKQQPAGENYFFQDRKLDFSDRLTNWKDWWWPSRAYPPHSQVIKPARLSSKLQSFNKDTASLTLPFLSYFAGVEWVNCCTVLKSHRDAFLLWRTKSSQFCQLHVFIIKAGWNALCSKNMNKTWRPHVISAFLLT